MDYHNKEKAYFTNVRLDLLSLIDLKNSQIKVLEIGAGHGYTIAYLKENKFASEVVGVDLPINRKKEMPPSIDNFIYIDIEETSLSQYNNYFDLIIFADVLEHLVSPEKVLKEMSLCLKTNGVILISIPNFRHFRALIKVFIKGDFSYEKEGLFDQTHLRFFCKRNVIELIQNSDLKVEKIVSSLKTYKKNSFSKLFNIITFGFFEDFLSVQYLVRVKKHN